MEKITIEFDSCDGKSFDNMDLEKAIRKLVGKSRTSNSRALFHELIDRVIDSFIG